MWIEVLYFLRAFEFSGGLIRMVFKVFYYTGPFLSILGVVLIGSTNCYYVLFSHVPEDNEDLFNASDEFHDTMFKMFQMLLLGENGGTEVPGQPVCTCAIY